MKHRKTWHLMLASILTALNCVATLAVQLPLPGSGYANPGDGAALFSAYLLGPWYAAAAAGMGAALADLLSGYAVYAPASLCLKGGMALMVSLLLLRLRDGRSPRRMAFTRAAVFALAETGMVGGYFLYDALALGRGMGALVSLPGSLAQGALGFALAMLLSSAMHSFDRRMR